MTNIDETKNTSLAQSNTDQIQWILDSFKIYDGKYKKEACEKAIQLKEEITPYLLDILKDVSENPTNYIGQKPEIYSHLYASMLLCFFKEPKAHELFLKIFTLPGEMPFDLFGDSVTEDLANFLYSTCDREIDGIKKISLFCQYVPFFNFKPLPLHKIIFWKAVIII